MEYEQSWKEKNDWFAVMSTAEKKGREEGEEIKAKKVALNAIKEGFSNEVIHKLTGLPIEEIEKLRNS